LKRDLDLVRHILLEVEKGRKSSTAGLVKAMEGGATDENVAKLAEHVSIMVDGGLLTGTKRGTPNVAGYEYREIELGWKGHEFLDSVRDSTIWRKTKEGASQVGSWTLDLLVELAKGYAKQKAKEILGLEL
jgi:Hypothetical protein (DUF2513)